MNLLPTSTAMDEVRRAADVAVLPVGSFEQHGAHLPLATDSIVANAIAQRLATAYELLLLPAVTVGCSHEHEGLLAGTVSISAPTLYAVVTDIAKSLERSAGITKLAIISGHGGNYVLANVVQEANVSRPRMTLYPGGAAAKAASAAAGIQHDAHVDMHGGEWETSILLHATPELVRDGWKNADHLASDRPDLLTLGMAGYTSSGIIGMPSLATAAKGSAILESLVKSFAERLAVLRSSDRK